MLEKQSKMQQENKKVDLLLGKFLGTLGGSLLRNLFTGKGVKAKIPRRRVIRAGEETIRAGEDMIKADEGTIRASQYF